MKIKKLQQVPHDKIGRVDKNNVKLEPHEESTILYLSQFGFDIELIRPSSTKKSNNPDILIMGTIWEIKGPESSNKTTIKNRFRKASKQSTKIVFDLRKVRKDVNKVEKQVFQLFKGDGKIRRMMIIEKDGTLLDIIK